MEAGDFCIRNSCDECHVRKIRCVSSINVCVACHQHGRKCSYGRRLKMGRPRTRRGNTMEGNPPKRLAEAEALDWDSDSNSLLAPVPQQDLECSKPTIGYGHSSILHGENDWCLDYASTQGNHQGVTHYLRYVLIRIHHLPFALTSTLTLHLAPVAQKATLHRSRILRLPGHTISRASPLTLANTWTRVPICLGKVL